MNGILESQKLESVQSVNQRIGIEKEELNNRVCCLYIIQEGKLGPIKIGYGNDIKSRLDSLQVGNPRKLTIIYFEEFDNAKDAHGVEKLLHKYLRFYALSGEWFEYREYYNEMIDGFKREGGVHEFLGIKNQFLPSNLKHSYEELLKKIIKEVDKDINHNNIDQLKFLSDELWFLRHTIIERTRQKRNKDLNFL